MLTLSAGPMLIGNLPNEPLNEHGSGGNALDGSRAWSGDGR